MFCVVFLKVKTNYQIELDQFCIKSMSSLTCCPSIKYHHSALQTTDLVCSRLQTGRLWRANNNWSIVWFRFVFFVSPLVQFRFLLLLCTGNANARHLGLLFCYISQSYIFPKHLCWFLTISAMFMKLLFKQGCCLPRKLKILLCLFLWFPKIDAV